MRFEITSPAVQQTPSSTYATMRQQAPIVQIELDFAGKNIYFVTRYQDAISILKDPRFANGTPLMNAGQAANRWAVQNKHTKGIFK